MEAAAALKCKRVPWKPQVCALVWQILFFNRITCCHCWKAYWDPEKSFFSGRRCWNFSQLEWERCLNSLHGAQMLWCVLQCRAGFPKCKSLRSSVNANILQPVLYSGTLKEQNTFPPPKASPGRPVGSWGRVLVSASFPAWTFALPSRGTITLRPGCHKPSSCDCYPDISLPVCFTAQW